MKARITGPDGKVVDGDASVAELEKLSLTPGYIVRIPSGDSSGALEFVAADEDGWRRVGPRKRIAMPKSETPA